MNTLDNIVNLCHCEKPLISMVEGNEFCSKCDAWLEFFCADTNCDRCNSRPNNPSQVTKKYRSKMRDV